MLVQVVLLLFICVNIVECRDTASDEAKYIDLLPEAEKQEFLNRIALRILAEIKSRTGAGEASVEVSDERLAAHDAYVQRIMEEETEKFKQKRRLGIQSNGSDVENDEASESQGPAAEKENVLGLGQDSADLSLLKKNIRIKKDTNEDIKVTSIESRRLDSEDTFTKIPAPLLYDGQDHLHSIATHKNEFEDSVSEPPENDFKVEGLRKRSDKSENFHVFESHHETTDNQSENEDNSEERSNVHNSGDAPNSRGDHEDTREEATTDVPRTVIDDFEPEEKYKESKIKPPPKIIIQSKSKTSASTDNILDLSNDKSFILNIKSTASTRTAESATLASTNDTLKITTQGHRPLASRPILRSEINSTESNVENDGAPGAEKLEENVERAEEQAAYRASTDNIDKDGAGVVLTTSNTTQENTLHYMTTEHTAPRDGSSKENSSDFKQSLRYGDGDKENVDFTFTAKYPLKNVHLSLPSTENYKSPYRVFEFSNKNSPFVPARAAAAGAAGAAEAAEAPHYAPVYNYEPSNAFYTGYNYFGPNYGENDKTNEVHINYNGVYKKLNKQNILQDYTKKTKTQNRNKYKTRGNLKVYEAAHGNFKSRSAAFQNHLLPAWKGGFSDINFNPNDYLDLDYYLGRTNDVPATDDDDVHGLSQSLYPQNPQQGRSEDAADAAARLKHYNVKDNIAALRNALYIHKYGKKAKIPDLITKNYQLKTKFTKWKQNFDPILRGLDDTFLIFLPGVTAGGKSGGRGAYDDKNIAVDYYFSRMNSEELPLGLSNEMHDRPTSHEQIRKVEKSNLKNTRTYDKLKHKGSQVINEKLIQIPLNPHNILKIDLAVQDGSNVNIIFRNVKKPEQDKFETRLNSYITVMRDMIQHDDKALRRYRWLASTVDVQSALDKLLQLTHALRAQEELNYSDFELMKYILFVFQTCNKIVQVDAARGYGHNGKDEEVDSVRTERDAGQRERGDEDQPLKTLRKIYEDIREIQEMSVAMSGSALLEFENFLLNLQSSLNKLHEAVKEIATITEYKKQRWFSDLKHLYLAPADRDATLRLLLHLATSKLFGGIEHGAKNGLEDNFIIFVQNHREEVVRTREDFIFVLRLMKAIKKMES